MSLLRKVKNMKQQNTSSILAGVIHETPQGARTTEWKHVHSLNRCKDGSIVLYGLDDQRTPEVIPARLFAGVRGLEL